MASKGQVLFPSSDQRAVTLVSAKPLPLNHLYHLSIGLDCKIRFQSIIIDSFESRNTKY